MLCLHSCIWYDFYHPKKKALKKELRHGATRFYYMGQNFHIWIRYFPLNLGQIIKSKFNFARYSSIDLKRGQIK